MSARKRRNMRVVEVGSDSDSSSSEDDKRCTPPQKIQKQQARSSERIRVKKNHVFQMPTRDDVLKDIPSVESPNKSFDRLKPRKLINNFTRVTHRYNYDHASDTSEDDDNFIDDDDLQVISSQSTKGDDISGDSSENIDSSKSDIETSYHLKKGLHASRLESDSDNSSSQDDDHGGNKMRHNSIIASDSDEQPDDTNTGSSKPADSSFPNSHEEYKYIADSSLERTVDQWSECTNIVSQSSQIVDASIDACQNMGDNKDQELLKNSEICCTEKDQILKNDHSSDSESELISPKLTSKKFKRHLHSAKKKKQLISSGSESDEDCTNTKRAVMLDSDSSDSDNMEENRLYSSNADSSDEERLPSERAQYMACRKQQKRNLLEALKAKRKGVKKT